MTRGAAVSATVGVDIGGTTALAVALSPAGTVLAEQRLPTSGDPEELEDRIARLITRLAEEHAVTGVGLAVAGFLSLDRREVRFAPHLPWRGRALPSRIQDRVGLPIVMDHDVNCAVWAEYVIGAARGAVQPLLLAVGTGIGVGVVLAGRVFRGAFGVAPELGHLPVVPHGRPCPCGRRGCLERYCSGTALVQTAREFGAGAGSPDYPDGHAVADAARNGDPVARRAVDDLVDWLAVTVGMAADLFDPDLVLLGGGVADSADLLLPALRDVFPGRVTGGAFRELPRVEVAAAGSAGAAIGAALLARDTAQR